MSKKIELGTGKLEGELTTLQETLVVYTTSSTLVVYTTDLACRKTAQRLNHVKLKYACGVYHRPGMSKNGPKA